jgi:D-alanyl-D-alanine-carboxypeptidase/D-alanyl-D-alanine-endopeptidase
MRTPAALLLAPAVAVTLLAPTAAQQHFPPDDEVRAIAHRAGTIPPGVGVVIGLLEPDGSRRVVTAGEPPYDGRTLFEIGSITKVLTGILLAEMAERGEVTIEQPVAELLPPEARVPGRGGRQIRLVDLSTHSSGLPRMPDNFEPADPGNPYIDYTVDRLYDFLRRHELRRDIGAASEYSNVAVGLLGHALARRGGSSYEALVTARVLEPLKMASTKITLSADDRTRLAPGHTVNGTPVPNWDLPEAFAGAGALRSNADDMLTFLAASLTPPDGTALGRAMRRAQAAHYTSPDGRPAGLGWGLSILKQEHHVLTHAGGTGGYLTFVGLDPARRIGVVVLTNSVPNASRIGLHLLDPRLPVTLAPIERSFLVLPIVLAALLTAGVFVAWRRTGATTGRAAHAAFTMAVATSVWMAVTYLAAALRVLTFPPQPPTMVVVFVLLVVLSVGLGVSPVGRRLAAGIPLAILVGVQSFRLPLELIMHRAYEAGLMPKQMSYSGLNFDILTGITALVVAVLYGTGRAGLRTVRAWNLLGTVLLVNIITIAWLSAPTPWRVFREGPANTWVATEPYIWLPAVMVAFAILGHIVVFRRLRAERAHAHAVPVTQLDPHAQVSAPRA